MRSIVQLTAAAVTLGLGIASAQAMPVAPPSSMPDAAAVQQVRDGCGPFGHRSHFGYCKPNGYGYGPHPYYGPRPFYGSPGFYGRRCFVRMTFYGPRRFCRW